MAVSTIQSLARDRDTPFTPSGWVLSRTFPSYLSFQEDDVDEEEKNRSRLPVPKISLVVLMCLLTDAPVFAAYLKNS
ncbi:hypothetical protein CDAR_59181 [Caerostris darwini]|uniref:Uncharacterized protein n=1 Tax=Caerostris darwini TaxID=1538125 RepID=A0AAV4X1Z9_9ARAC|nr:hypothetical protein CDAR_59181 [Caerostris darwini]